MSRRTPMPAPTRCAGREPDEPRGYLAWHEWAERKAEAHEQRRCGECGYWHVWVPR